MIEGGATLRGIGILYRGDGVMIDHVLGAANYRSLRADEARTTQIIFRRLPMAPPNARN